MNLYVKFLCKDFYNLLKSSNIKYLDAGILSKKYSNDIYLLEYDKKINVNLYDNSINTIPSSEWSDDNIKSRYLYLVLGHTVASSKPYTNKGSERYIYYDDIVSLFEKIT